MAKEKAIYEAQAAESGKPANIIEKMVTGRLEKFFKEVCLVEQAFVKNPDVTVTQFLNEVGAKRRQGYRSTLRALPGGSLRRAWRRRTPIPPHPAQGQRRDPGRARRNSACARPP